MSVSKVKTITCPKCGGTGDFTVYNSVNTKEDPELAEKLKDMTLFEYKCPHCGALVFVDYGLLYHNVEKGVMIYYVRNDADAEKAVDLFRGKENAAAEELKGRYIYRVVRSYRQLKEKIMIFDENMDDRVMELAKLLYLTKFQVEYPDLVPEIKESYVYGSEGEYQVAFRTKDGEVSTDFNMQDYEDMDGRFEYLLKPIRRSGDIIVDQNWAMNLVHYKEGEE
jgi:DNA-directed RNA polymerase subunit RPC12/RpoP